jgi:homoserine dehydrogenase
MKLRLAIIGFGTVGQGFGELLLAKKKELLNKFGLEWEVVALSDLKYGAAYQAEGLDLQKILETTHQGKMISTLFPRTGEITTERIIEQRDYDILIELTVTNIQTGEPAYTFIRQALAAGKHVITTNKGPTALKLSELQSVAQRNHAILKYEGTVLSGTPLINLTKYNLAGLEIHKIEGILNGTCNFILTKMDQGQSYEEALAEAQRLGYAEDKPEADVEGWDATAKVMILSQAIFETSLSIDDVEREGITALTAKDIEIARNEKKVWKLLARIEKTAKGIRASVRPEKISLSHPLASVSGSTNALTFTVDYLQQVTINGPGAGRYETGYAVLNDLISIHRELSKSNENAL